LCKQLASNDSVVILTNIQVEQEIANQIDELVKEQVEECLKTHIPKEVQDELAISKRELEELNLRLHNS
jgi:predicted metal-dependent peptidase